MGIKNEQVTHQLTDYIVVQEKLPHHKKKERVMIAQIA